MGPRLAAGSRTSWCAAAQHGQRGSCSAWWSGNVNAPRCFSRPAVRDCAHLRPFHPGRRCRATHALGAGRSAAQRGRHKTSPGQQREASSRMSSDGAAGAPVAARQHRSAAPCWHDNNFRWHVQLVSQHEAPARPHTCVPLPWCTSQSRISTCRPQKAMASAAALVQVRVAQRMGS